MLIAKDEMRCCPDCKVEVILWFRVPGNEWKCPKCERLFEFFDSFVYLKKDEINAP